MAGIQTFILAMIFASATAAAAQEGFVADSRTSSRAPASVSTPPSSQISSALSSISTGNAAVGEIASACSASNLQQTRIPYSPANGDACSPEEQKRIQELMGNWKQYDQALADLYLNGKSGSNTYQAIFQETNHIDASPSSNKIGDIQQFCGNTGTLNSSDEKMNFWSQFLFGVAAMNGLKSEKDYKDAGEDKDNIFGFDDKDCPGGGKSPAAAVKCAMDYLKDNRVGGVGTNGTLMKAADPKKRTGFDFLDPAKPENKERIACVQSMTKKVCNNVVRDQGTSSGAPK